MQALINAGQMLAAIGVGAREAIALGIIAEMDSKAQSPDIKAALGHYSKDPMAVVAVLKGKGLVRPEGNRNGWPFWRITAEARMRLDALNVESHKWCSLRLEKLESAIKPVLAACHGLRDTDKMKSHYPGCMSDEECKCQDHDNATEDEAAVSTCKICDGSGTRIIGERDGDNAWNRCVPCECRNQPLPMIPVRVDKWASLNRDAKDAKERYKEALQDMEEVYSERDEARRIAKEACEMLSANGFETNYPPMPWDSDFPQNAPDNQPR